MSEAGKRTSLGAVLLFAGGAIGIVTFLAGLAMSAFSGEAGLNDDMWFVGGLFAFAPPAMLVLLLVLVGLALKGGRDSRALLAAIVGLALAVFILPTWVMIEYAKISASNAQWDESMRQTFNIDQSVRGYGAEVQPNVSGAALLTGEDLTTVEFLKGDDGVVVGAEEYPDSLRIDISAEAQPSILQLVRDRGSFTAALVLEREELATVEVKEYACPDLPGGQAFIEYRGADSMHIYELLGAPAD